MRTRTPHSRRWVLGALLIALALQPLQAKVAACAAPPQPTTEYSPGVSPGAAITLLDAIGIALQHDPTIRRAQQVTFQQKGSLRQSQGVFDLSGVAQPSVNRSTTYLYSGQRKGQEQLRDLRRQIANESDRVADGLQQQLSQGNNLPPDCSSMSSVLNDVVVTTQIGQQSICIEARQRLELQVWQNLAKNFGLTTLGQALDDAMRARTEFIMDLLHGLAFAMREQLRHMGTVPRSDTVTTFSLDLGLSKPFRNGIVFSPAILLTAVNDNFDDKPESQNYGGKGLPDKVTSTIGFELDVPLGQGSGKISVDAPERSARMQLQASLEGEAFAVSSSVQNTELAYWQLVGAQETLALLQRSLDTEQKLLELGDALVKGDQIAPADLAYLKARIASTQGSVAQARQAALQARINLAGAMGLAVQRVDDAPQASDSFPPLPQRETLEAIKLSELADTALANRSDLASTRKLLDSANILAAAARADLRRQIDLTFGAGYQGLHEGGIVTHWGDYWSSDWNALSDFRAGPSAAIMINFSWPFKNNVALGRYAQARSLALSTEVQANDLKRVIGSDTTRLVGSLFRAARVIEQSQAAADLYQQSLDAETEKFKLGESTAVDILLTEDNQLSQLLTLVSARQTFAGLMTQLRFATGSLVSYKIENDAVRLEDLTPVGLDFPRRSAR
ncbi:MAG TPA: TolC family protein [Thermoanaerobaculaceae bacterium]|nr:TolC family protein [Thermoanaerobaculaceae bacterium]